MSNGHDLYLDLCAAMALGALDEGDRHVIEQHLAGGCAECRALLEELASPIEVLARSVTPAKPGRGLKARVMVAVAQSATRARAPGTPEPDDDAEAAGGNPFLALLPRWGWAAAAAVLLVVAGVGWWRVADLSERVSALESAEAPVPPAPPDAEALFVAFLADHPGAKAQDVPATKDGDASRQVRVAYDAASRKAVVHFRNFKAPAGHDFELWTVRDGKPYSEGVIRTDASGQAVMRLENTGDPAKLNAFAVSDETSGGSKDRQTPRQVWYAAGVS